MNEQNTKQSDGAIHHRRFISFSLFLFHSKVKSLDSWRFTASEVTFIMSRNESRRRLTNNSGNKSQRRERIWKRRRCAERVSQDGEENRGGRGGEGGEGTAGGREEWGGQGEMMEPAV